MVIEPVPAAAWSALITAASRATDARGRRATEQRCLAAILVDDLVGYPS
jgi:hypothetical protein